MTLGSECLGIQIEFMSYGVIVKTKLVNSLQLVGHPLVNGPYMLQWTAL